MFSNFENTLKFTELVVVIAETTKIDKLIGINIIYTTFYQEGWITLLNADNVVDDA